MELQAPAQWLGFGLRDNPSSSEVGKQQQSTLALALPPTPTP